MPKGQWGPEALKIMAQSIKEKPSVNHIASKAHKTKNGPKSERISRRKVVILRQKETGPVDSLPINGPGVSHANAPTILSNHASRVPGVHFSDDENQASQDGSRKCENTFQDGHVGQASSCETCMSNKYKT